MSAKRYGRYEVVEELARGAQGKVFQARDTRDGRAVALKVVRPRNERAARRFVTEVRALSRLDHPNLVEVYSWGEGGGEGWLSQELLPGKSLQQRIERWGPLPVDEAVRIASALARGLEHAHQAGVLHRDVKPDNVILRPNGQPVLIDFGVAFDLEADEARVSTPGELLGSPGYWAPEQARGELEKVGVASDVFGLGATLYGLLAGRPPTPQSMLAGYLNRFESVTPLPDVNPAVPSALWKLCERCLEPDPARRPSMAEVIAALEAPAVAEGQALSAGWVVGLVLGACVALGLGLLVWGGAAPLRVGDAPLAVEGGSSGDLEVLLERARAAFAAEDFARTRALLEEAERLAPQDSRVYAKLGTTLAAEERWAEARLAFERALDLEPQAAAVHVNLGVLETVGGDFDAAADRYRKALELEPGNVQALSGLGHADFMRGDYAQAERALSRALVLDPDNAQVWENRGRARTALEDLDGALADHRESLRLDPERWQPYYLRAEIHEARKEWEAARENADRCLELNPGFLIALQTRGTALLELGRYREALTDLQTVLEADGDNPRVRAARARVWLMRGEWERALEDLDHALARRPDRPAELVNRSVTKLQLGDFDGARADCERALELGYSPTVVRTNLGAIHMLRGDHQAALRELELALERDPESAQAHENRGAVYVELGRLDEAMHAFDKALRYSPRAFSTLTLRGVAYRKLGDLERAERDLRAALELSPHYYKAMAHLGLVCSERGDHEQALELIGRSAALAPREALPQCLLGRALLAAGRPVAAAKACRRGLSLRPSVGVRRELEQLAQECAQAGAPMDE